jgi:predicted DNA-binding ribbon-helix-helix protein
MEVHMELSKKTTILFPPDLHTRLSAIAAQRGISLGELVRSACERQYATLTSETRVAAVRKLAEMKLPIGTPQEMKAESAVPPEGIA